MKWSWQQRVFLIVAAAAFLTFFYALHIGFTAQVKCDNSERYIDDR